MHLAHHWTKAGKCACRCPDRKLVLCVPLSGFSWKTRHVRRDLQVWIECDKGRICTIRIIEVMVASPVNWR